MSGCSVCTLPFFAPCNDILVMLVCTICWLSMQLYTLAYMSMLESCSLVCHPCFNTMKLYKHPIQTYICPSQTPPLFICYLALFSFLLSSWFLCLPYLSCLSISCLFIMLFATFPSMACLLVTCLCLCLCMYEHGVRMHGARARSPGHKQNGRGCEHADMSLAARSEERRVGKECW